MIVAVAGGVLAYVLVSDSSSNTGSSGGGTAASASPASEATLAPSSFDPLGDGSEDPAGASNAIDGNPATVWSTDQYYNQFPDGDKTGVGLAFDLGATSDVSKVLVTTRERLGCGDLRERGSGG